MTKQIQPYLSHAIKQGRNEDTSPRDEIEKDEQRYAAKVSFVCASLRVSMGRPMVLATIGTLGDLNPFITLGLELQQGGHVVVIASHRGYGDRDAHCAVDDEFPPALPSKRNCFARQQQSKIPSNHA